MQNIRFSVKDKASGAEISGASIKVKKGYYTTISPESDGSYKLQKGVSYNWTVEAPNYKTANGKITPDEDTTIDVELEKKYYQLRCNLPANGRRYSHHKL